MAAGAGDASAQSLREALADLSKSNKRIVAADADLKAAKENIEVAWGDWYPTLDLTANIGHEEQQKPSGSDDTNMVPRNIETTVTQKLWDFGSTNSAIRRANLTYRQTSATRDATLQTVLLEGVTGYLNVVRASKLLNFARGSADNIKRQAELENAKVQRGSGFSTDVLQAKTQLAGALARVIQSEGALKTALNRYRAVFGKLPEDIAKMRDPRLPLEMLPESLDNTVASAKDGNPQLKASRLSASIAREDVAKTRIDEFLPTFEVIGEHKVKEDNGGTVGSQQDWLVKLEASYDLNLGMTAVNTLRASKESHIATVNRFGDTRDQIEEQARNAWDRLQTAQANAEHLHNQANIAAEFLELARRERQLGNRSLIDVLAGETALINASSDATSADTDVAIAVFTLLNVMGRIAPDIVQ
ncbi:MAG: TolC family protein [Rhodospirillaceae bacterium]